ncbi:proline-rich extensin-like protein EPR1 [Scaptodrosophila lebanonensis]|uniref:Proline-rich extensin-like protein EPR1 n=1 Tax=Drosophila lebanonensis TaxID=7225 RepID=A0A6J2TUZ9_DROLE|nr:proline-rich extensin-like protein EPR1 [Scaptodrosophila lebanonensis]
MALVGTGSKMMNVKCMKHRTVYVLSLLLVAVSAASLRSRRDVSELAPKYLPPAELQASKSTSEDQSQGYVYRTVRHRRYRLRQRRDVSHLPLEYLPPVELPPLPSRDYLPPVERQAASLPSVVEPARDYLPPVEPKPNNEYLPPAPVNELVEEEPEPEPTTTTEAEPEPTTTELPTTEATTEAVLEEEPELKTHEPVESGALQADGYHYNKPAFIPDLSPVPEIKELPTREYLPPLGDNVVVADGPDNDESAALLDDGYHYRAIKRVRLF